MKIVSNVSRMIAGSVLTLLTAPVFSAAYSPSVNNCSITRVGTDLWLAKFTYTITYYSVSDSSSDNGFYLYLIQANAQGKPGPYYGPYAVAKWTNLNLGANPSAKTIINSTNISFYGADGSSLIRNNVDVSVNFSTAGNNAYPALVINLRHLYINGGGTVSGWHWVTSAGCSRGQTPPVLPPIEEINPVDPDFKMDSAQWLLNTVDVGDLPDVTAAGSGYEATINNVASNRLCVNYVTAGVKNKQYALAVSNTSSTQGGRRLFAMQGPAGSQLFYNLQLANDTSSANNFDFPASGTPSYITLGSTPSSSSATRSEMCWTPKVNLFKNSSTASGIHSDTVNFLITPKA